VLCCWLVLPLLLLVMLLLLWLRKLLSQVCRTAGELPSPPYIVLLECLHEVCRGDSALLAV